MAGIIRCCDWLSGCSLREDDHHDDARAKKFLFAPVTAGAIIVAALLVQNIGTSLYAFILASAILLCTFLFALVGFLGRFIRATRVADFLIIGFTVGILVADIGSASLSRSRTWILIILALDAVLVLERHYLPPLLISTMLVYLAVEGLEMVWRYGLYEFGRWGTDESDSFCSCASPPCGLSVAGVIGYVTPQYAVLLVDFYLTRGFAAALRQQMHCLKSVMSVSEVVAAALTRYDIECAENAIMTNPDLPAGLTDSYMRLLDNLRSYRDYLPDSLLEDENDAPGGHRVPAPGVGVEGETDVGMVFTDIQSSTALWEEYPNEMHEAL
eukprot:Hpha_TRINITY_DN16781_c4_g2::TRINITY_DN16781_c4_g2_i1::g.78140::m.78140